MLISLILIACGFGLILYTRPVVDFTGSFDFAERILGTGGTYNFLKVIGLLMIITSFMWMTGTLQPFLAGIFGPFLPGV